MRTTIRMDDELLRDAKKLAAESGRSLTKLIEDLLREKIATREKKAARTRARIPTTKGTGLQAGVDLDDSASLLGLMEGQ